MSIRLTNAGQQYLTSVVQLGLHMGDFFRVNMFWLSPLAKEIPLDADSRTSSEAHVRTWFQRIVSLFSELELEGSCQNILTEIDKITADVASKELTIAIFQEFPLQVDRWGTQLLNTFQAESGIVDPRAPFSLFGMAFCLSNVLSKYEVMLVHDDSSLGAEVLLGMAEPFLEYAAVERESASLIPPELSEGMRHWVSTIKKHQLVTPPVHLSSAESDRLLNYLRSAKSSLACLGSAFSATDIFISYSQPDGSIVRAISARLEEEGWSTWHYERDSFPGLPHLEQTAQQMQACQCVIVLLSTTSISSEFVTTEIFNAHQNRKPILPVLIDLTHADLIATSPKWGQALGFNVAIRWEEGDQAQVLSKLCSGLRRLLDRGSAP